MALGAEHDKQRLKELLLELLREDREFRKVVAAELGLLEILERLDRLGEEVARVWRRLEKLDERVARLEERVAGLEERIAFLEERMLEVEKRLEEHAKAIRALQEQVARMQEQMNRMQEQVAKMQEQIVKLQEQALKHSEALEALVERIEELQRLVNIVAHRFGVLAEAGLRETLKAVVERILGVARVSKLVIRDEEGVVYGYPTEVDIDVVVRDSEHVIIEVKSRVDPGDVRIAALKARLYERVYGVKPRVLVVGDFVSPKAYEAAARLGVELKPALRSEVD